MLKKKREDEEEREGGNRRQAMAPEIVAPECPVCFQPYDEHHTTPRVLPCGHSLCDVCISTLSPDPRSSFLRCPECNQPSKLGRPFPKNFELLRCLINGAPSPSPIRSSPSHPRSLFRSVFPVFDVSVSELFKWIIPQQSARICDNSMGQFFVTCEEGSVRGFPALFLDAQTVWPRLRHVTGVDYRQKVRSSLESLSGNDVRDLILLLNLQGGIFGFWMNTEDSLFLVCKVLTVLESSQPSCSNGTMPFFEMSSYILARAMEVCEIFMELHNHQTVTGLITPQCLCSTEYKHVRMSISAFLRTRENLRLWLNSCSTKVTSKDFEDARKDFLFCYSSPEFLTGLKELDTFSERSITCKTDSWTLACLLFHLLLGGTPWDDLLIDEFTNKANAKYAESWLQKKLSTDDDSSSKDTPMQLLKLLLRCFSYIPEERPCISKIWDFLLHMQMTSDTNCTSSLNQGSDESECCKVVTGSVHCLILGCSPKEIREAIATGKSSGLEMESLENSGQSQAVKNDIVLNGHSGQITCLTLCGEYLLSAAFDRTICVWSIKEAKLLKTLRGHSQRVMALVFDQQSSLCVSGDYGGELCVWVVKSVEIGFLVKWHHHQDWRYTGIASLALSSDHVLYSGSGDKTIKAWSMQDYELLATMEGHKSLVSALLVDDGLLYSGSLDGTIRLWLRSDHSPLAILHEPMEWDAVRALEISRDLVLVGYQNGRIQVWKDEIYMNTIIAHSGGISSFCISGDILYSASWDGTVKACKLSELLGDTTMITLRSYDAAVTAMTCHSNIIFAGLSSKLIHCIITN